MADEIPLEPRFVVWPCDHCRIGIKFDVVQLAGRAVCRMNCPHCGQETSLQDPPPPPVLPEPVLPIPELPVLAPLPTSSGPAPGEPEVPAFTPWAELLSDLPSIPMPAPAPERLPATPPTTAPVSGPAPAPPSGAPKPITVSLPPDPPPPTPTRAPVDVRWLTDLGVAYFRQHQFGEAFLCFRHAARQGFATAQFCLAVCYFNGHGTAQDEAAALPWLRQAAAQGDANAEFTLGLAYQLGRGVTPDPLLATQWLQQAARHGHPEAVLRNNEINIGKTLPGPAAPAAATVPAAEKNSPRPGHDLQRLILGVFKKK